MPNRPLSVAAMEEDANRNRSAGRCDHLKASPGLASPDRPDPEILPRPRGSALPDSRDLKAMLSAMGTPT